MGEYFIFSKGKIFVTKTGNPEAVKKMTDKIHYIKINFCILKNTTGRPKDK